MRKLKRVATKQKQFQTNITENHVGLVEDIANIKNIVQKLGSNDSWKTTTTGFRIVET